MIQTKKDLKEYLAAERILNAKQMALFFFARLFAIGPAEGWNEQRLLSTYRKCEYFLNNKSKSCVYHFFSLLYGVLYHHYAQKLNIYLSINTIGKGLRLYHIYKTQTILQAEIGENVIIRPGVILANQGNFRTHNIGPTIGDYVEFSFGVKIFGPIKVGRGCIINANSVVMSNVPPYAIVVGNPAKIVGFTKTPEQAMEFEKLRYELSNRTPFEVLKKNYEQYYLDRLDDIRGLICM